MKKITCNTDRCTGSLMLTAAKTNKSNEEIIEEATDFINQFYASVKRYVWSRLICLFKR